jgi:hypothetical protein
MAVFQSGAVLSDAPGFHYHNHAHDVFLVTKGYLKLEWQQVSYHGTGGLCIRATGISASSFCMKEMCDLTFSQTVIHNPEILGPHTEIYPPPPAAELGD